jgi:tetratricopeptide (TPR) repeat protein
VSTGPLAGLTGLPTRANASRWLCSHQGQFDEAVSAAKTVLNQNPQSAYALRILAASLAKQGRLNDAAAVIREVLNIEPHLTLSKLRARKMFIKDDIWRDYAAALGLAGLPE